ncbi:CD81 molecule a isoform X2 [Engraulis encrasicolus]|uniref:CD81 molecule a isoform X2 n=2 Tax=Engraulis encrasicolus TaxID=184585 RepID=UPI002FD19B0B
MGVDGCTKCIKYILFFCNFIFWLAGGVILGVALWLRHDRTTSSLLDLNYEGEAAPNTFYISVYILIVVGAVMMFVGFLGCYGAIQESQCLLGTFFACLVLLFACEVAAGIWGFMNKDTVAREFITFYDSVYEKGMVQGVLEDKKRAATTVLKAIHETLDCCGKDSTIINLFSQLSTDVCPDGTTVFNPSKNCHERIRSLFGDKVHLVGFAALGVAVIMIFEMIFSMVLCCSIRNSPVY